MSKRIIAVAILMLTLALIGCQPTENATGAGGGNEEKNERGEFVFKGEVTDLSNYRHIEMEIIDSEIAFGTYLALTDKDTLFFDNNGGAITREDIKVGDIIEVVFSGQVMQSFPPKIYAQKIYLTESK